MKLELTIKSDLNKIQEIEMNLENLEFILPFTIERHKQVIHNEDEEHLSILDKNSELVGFVILAGITNKNRSIEFKRIVVSKKSKGYGSKAIELIKHRCFEKYNCNRLWLDVFEFNQRAIDVYEKLGFHKEGVLRECILTAQGFKSLVVMSLLKNEYD